MNVITHYDLLIDEGNDPFHDPPELRSYMDQWDGARFLDALQLAHRFETEFAHILICIKCQKNE